FSINCPFGASNFPTMKTKTSIHAVPRRQFLKGSAMGALGFTFLPGHVLGLRGAQSANEKLNIASIGCAGQAASDINGVASENIVALCDVDWRHAAGTFKKYPDARRYKDFRKMLDAEKNIDAVIVAIPDHM